MDIGLRTGSAILEIFLLALTGLNAQTNASQMQAAQIQAKEQNQETLSWDSRVKEGQSQDNQSESRIVVHKEEVVIPGLKEEFDIVFLADTHISLCDERDSELLEKASARYAGFYAPDGDAADVSFVKLMDYVSDEKPELLILGGDIIDSAMWASVDFVGKSLEELQIPWLYEMGNHDFEYGGEYFSEKAYSEYLPRLGEITGTDKGYQQVRYDDFIVFAADDKNNQVSEEAVEALEVLCREGKPIIIVTHVPIEPLTESALVEETKQVWGSMENGRSRVLMGANSCIPNETTRKFLDLILAKDSPVSLVLSGHIHFYHKDYLTGDLLQIVTGAGFEKELVRLTLKP